jgi:DNA helicase-2/ATP-dependent DNA helicase PcrA
MVTQAVWDAERVWLEQVLRLVRQRLAEVRRVAGEHEGRARAERQSLWEEGPRQILSYEDWIELAQASMQMGQSERSAAYYSHLARRLEKMSDSPYFARVDFREDGAAQSERIYIGISGLHDEESGNLVVYDWRAPISSLFYDAEPGQAAYRCQGGVVTGVVELKRQYRISHGKLEYMFDTDLKIDDEVLQELLARNVDEKMRTIVTSIQREQNRVIRDDEHQVLLVQGPAGSGKTAIALHRAAYLLYTHRDSMDARQIVVFSPNSVFSDYISAVLPELGEENVTQTTFYEYARKYLGNGTMVESVYDQLEYLLSGREDANRVAAIRFKGGEDFRRALQRYVQFLDEGGATRFFDVVHEDAVIMSKQEMADLFERHRTFPLSRRLEKIRQRALFLLAPREEARRREWKERLAKGPDKLFDWEIKRESVRRAREEFAPLHSILAAWAAFDARTAYRQLFADESLLPKMLGDRPLPPEWSQIRRLTLAALDEGRIPYEDTTPLLYLKKRLEGVPVVDGVRHVIIDEAQDYTSLQFELFGLVFPRCTLTVLGDLNQSVHPYLHIDSYDTVMTALARERAGLVHLTNSYRSTRQIMDFARAVLGASDQVQVIRREGELPRLVQVQDGQLAAVLQADIRRLQEQGMRSVAVLCKTTEACRRLYQTLRRSVNIRLLTAADTHFRIGAVILPAYLAKGLEFDAVLIADAEAKAYHACRELGLFYTACTRALHVLRLYYSGAVSPFIAGVPQELYEKVEEGSAAAAARPEER